MGLAVVALGLSCGGDLPRPGIEPLSPTLAGRFFTTEPPGRPHFIFALSLLLNTDPAPRVINRAFVDSVKELSRKYLSDPFLTDMGVLGFSFVISVANLMSAFLRSLW